MAGAETNRIIEQVEKCPSGALSFAWLNQPEEVKPLPETSYPLERIECLADGPILVHGKFVIEFGDGTETLKEGTVALCRCGGSGGRLIVAQA